MRLTLPFKIETASKAFVTALLLFSAFVLPVCSQEDSGVLHMRLNHEEARRKAYEANLTKWQALLQEYRQGKRDDHDGVAILFNILNDFGALHSTGTAEDIALTKEYQQLLNKHPDYRINLPIETHDQIEAEAAAQTKAQDATRSSSTYIPTDANPISYYQHGNNVAVIYQYKIEFFHLKPAELLTMALIRGETKTAEPPYKIMTFQKSIHDTEPRNWYSSSGPVFLVCTDPEPGYFARTASEERGMGAREIPWRNPNGKFLDYCGAISIDDGKAFEISAEWNPPVLTRPIGIVQDGSEGLFGVGRWTPSNEGDEVVEDESGDGLGPHFVYRYLIRWVYPDKINKIDIRSLSDKKLRDLAHKFRVRDLVNRTKHPSYYENR